MSTRFLWQALMTTAVVLIVVFILNMIPFTRGLVQTAIR